MKIISKSFLLSSVVSLVLPQTSFASLSSAYTSLVDTSQNQAFESKPAQSLKLAAVHFITNDGGVRFGGNNPGNQEFLSRDLCKNSGYRYEGCPAGYVPSEACPHDNSFVKECINPDIWCRDNDYNVTSCTLPKYLSDQCPYSDTLYKSCEEDNARACQEAGYVAECEPGKVKDKACPYDESYGTCICNPCTGFDYTAAEASAQGYVPGEVCNSCGTTKYKRSEAPCDGFKTCDCGGATGAQTCWSGTTKKFDTCKECCDTSVYKYDTANCTGDYQLAGNSCGGKYDTCILHAKYLYGNGDVSRELYGYPIGVVFDEEKRLAVGLGDICPWESVWGDDAGDIPELENCRGPNLWDNPNFGVCGADGRYNTDVMTASGKHTPAVYANRYGESHCIKDFCEKTKWFVPSVKELFILFEVSDSVNAALEKMRIEGRGVSADLSGFYWSSTEFDAERAWRVSVGGAFESPVKTAPSNTCIRMVVKY